MKKLTLDNLDDLAIGSAILGSGGGGDPRYPHMAARYEIEQNGPVTMISASELKPDDLVVPICFMGTSFVEMEKLPSGREFQVMFEALENHLRRKIDVIMPVEIGGGNAFTPLIAAAKMGYPVLDADTLGRAFPELQMTSCSLFDVNLSPGFATDALGNTTIIYAQNGRMLENIGRQISVAMGSNNAFSMHPLSGAQAQKCLVYKTISKAMSIGKAHREAKKKGKDPLDAILNLCKGTLLCSGRIVDIDRVIAKAFLYGTVVIENMRDKMNLIFQNEYLIAKLNNEIVATTPDILMLLEQETGTPITSESLQYGLKVNLIALPAPNIWTSPEGLALVGPRYFGYEVDYQPISKRVAQNFSLTLA